MKKYIVFAFACIIAASALAQGKLSDEKLDKLIDAKMKLLQEELNLSRQQVNDLADSYRQYNLDMQKIRNDAFAKERELKCDTPKDAAKIMNLRADSRIAIIKVQKKYYTQFEKTLTAKQLLKFDRAEEKIHRKILDYIHKYNKDQKKGKNIKDKKPQTTIEYGGNKEHKKGQKRKDAPNADNCPFDCSEL